jgi:hypothetical protein
MSSCWSSSPSTRPGPRCWPNPVSAQSWPPSSWSAGPIADAFATRQRSPLLRASPHSKLAVANAPGDLALTAAEVVQPSKSPSRLVRAVRHPVPTCDSPQSVKAPETHPSSDVSVSAGGRLRSIPTCLSTSRAAGPCHVQGPTRPGPSQVISATHLATFSTHPTRGARAAQPVERAFAGRAPSRWLTRGGLRLGSDAHLS